MLLDPPGFNFRVYLTDSLVEEGLTVDLGIKHGREGSGRGQIRGGREGGGLDTVETMGVGNGVVFVLFREEVEDPSRGFCEAGGEAPFDDGKVVECIRGLEVRGGQLGIMEAFVDGGEEFKGKFEPGLAGEDRVQSVKWGGEGLAGATKAVEGNAGSMGVGDRVMVKRVGNDDGGGLGITNKVGAQVLEG